MDVCNEGGTELMAIFFLNLRLVLVGKSWASAGVVAKSRASGGVVGKSRAKSLR